jgi:hypothetical protein
MEAILIHVKEFIGAEECLAEVGPNLQFRVG